MHIRKKKRLKSENIEYEEFIKFIIRYEEQVNIPFGDRLLKVDRRERFKKYRRKITNDSEEKIDTYVDDMNLIRSKGNYLPKKQKNTKIYISDNIIYDRVSKIKHMLIANGIIPKDKLLFDIYMIQIGIKEDVTIRDIENMRRKKIGTEDIDGYIESVHREIKRQRELEKGERT